ncbi:ATP-grasp domain-containing protein [Marinihelvus fidelis]|uniref:ATP-grasp domain-containing protein n=1 Tax=Marinihelvus fidelis TaxID=2613842 RepID=A0A5N0T6I0_9GAMM|nr:ATP-grasp domain-containing protein [Marinihelvus fidelis]KAA9129747.1 ATP-grasp domain-containing protein [Marinihelvus fidelis]
MKNVLVFPCGSEIGLEIHRSLANSIHFNLIGASSVDDHGRFTFANYIGGVPLVDNDNFVDSIRQIIEKHDIDLIMPAHDSVVLKLAENQSFLDATVVTSPKRTCRTCRSKILTYEALRRLVKTPVLFAPEEVKSFPVFLKPDIGQGSRGASIVNSRDELECRLENSDGVLVQEYLPGEEYTVDCFTDRHRKLRFVGGRKRARISNGISVNSYEVLDLRFTDIAQSINDCLHLRGAWFFQLKERANGDLVLLEVAPRIAGTMALFRMDGVNFSLLSLFDALNLDIEIIRNNQTPEIDRALAARYINRFDYSNVYVDFDDTLIIRNSVNALLMAFLYQAKSKGARIVLLTRHKLDIFESLDKYCIARMVFDEIYVLTEYEPKSKYVNKGGIFIDDSFSERLEVSSIQGVKVYSPDAVESLLDWTS